MRKIIASATVAATAFLAGCGLGTAGGYIPTGQLDGPVEDISLEGATLSVGSKNFTEQIILGKIAAILMESAGANVKDLTNIPGSTSARQALVQGDMDMMFEYTGSAWITYLGNPDPIPGTQAQFEAVAQADKANGLTWLPPAAMNNTYALATNAQTAEETGVTSLADIKDFPIEEQTFCTDSEFLARNDGLIPMLAAYGVAEPSRERIVQMDSGAVYSAINNGDCTFGVTFATDGRIKALDLNPLSDPQGFFPKYNVAPVVRTETFDKYPQLAQLFAPVITALSDEKMQELNARVDIDGEDYAAVAHDFLEEEGLLES